MKYLILLVSVIFIGSKGLAQNESTIILQNGSFEGKPTCCQTPVGWTDCGFKGETPPDIQPALNQDNRPFFGVTQKAFDGDTYLGMVVRENETYERVTQKLEKPLRSGHCYSFSIMLCRSDTYLSASNRSEPNNLKQFTEPVIFRVWGGESICDEKQLLVVSDPVVTTEWMKYNFQFKTDADFNYIIFEAYYNNEIEGAYNGNVLLDKVSDIVEIDCGLLNKK